MIARGCSSFVGSCFATALLRDLCSHENHVCVCFFTPSCVMLRCIAACLVPALVQVGFTAEGQDGRSSTYASDICKMIRAPVLHVNAENMDHVVKAATWVSGRVVGAAHLASWLHVCHNETTRRHTELETSRHPPPLSPICSLCLRRCQLFYYM